MKVVNCQPYAPAALTPPQEISLVLISARDWIDHKTLMQNEGLNQWKIPIIPSGIDPPSFRLVSQCLKQLRHLIPHINTLRTQNTNVFSGNVNVSFAYAYGVFRRVKEMCLCDITWHINTYKTSENRPNVLQVEKMLRGQGQQKSRFLPIRKRNMLVCCRQ
jgi:hypothetical protein